MSNTKKGTREMNANEIALEFEEYLKEIEELPWGNHQILCDQAATMLRQQQAEIDLLRTTQPNIDYNKELLKPTFVGRELTDEEIAKVIEKIANSNEYVYSLYEDFEGIEFSRVGIFEFARAILRKAQENG